MFKLTLQIGLYDQKLVRKEDFGIKSDLICSNPFLKYKKNPQQFQYKEGLHVLETMFCVFV